MSTAIAVKERPVLFSGPMIRAILEGRKTVTRRVINHPIPDGIAGLKCTGDKWQFHHNAAYSDRFPDGLLEIVNIKCPYGVKGDRLWVREAWYQGQTKIWYKADIDDLSQCGITGWKPSIFMPRASSRITLEVVSVRVERLQDITEEDAIAEGVERHKTGWKCYDYCPDHDRGYDTRTSATASFMSLWNSINRDRGYSWDINPYVWRVEFRRVEA